jgi:Recombination endonuclease VII
MSNFDNCVAQPCEKICRVCKKLLSPSAFRINPIRFNRKYSTCKKCKSKYIRKWQNNHWDRRLLASKKSRHKKKIKAGFRLFPKPTPIGQRGRMIMHKYKIDRETCVMILDELINSECSACGKKETTKYKNSRVRSLSIDHNHKTGKIRDLLCLECNSILGFCHDSVERLVSLIKYLERHSK